MDPLTGVLKVAELVLTFGMKVYDDTPLADRQHNAGDWAKFVHGIGDVILSAQEKINAALGVVK